jgi:hypothetical protein
MAAADGTWKGSVKTPMGDQPVTLVFTTSGTELTGTMSNGDGTVPIEDGKADGNSVSWKAHLTSPMPMNVTCTATIDGDSISGSAHTMFGNAPFSGKRA